MKAIILAAGYATRLYPLTKNMPKPLLTLNGKPIIDYIVEQIEEVKEVNEIIVISNHRFIENFKAWAENKKSKHPITVIDDGTTTEETRLGAIGDISFVIEKCGISEELMIIAGDNFYTFDIKDFYNFYKDQGRDCVIAKEIEDQEALKSFAVAKIDRNNKILELVEKPEKPESNIAIFAAYIYTKESVSRVEQYLKQGNKPDAPGFFVQWLYKEVDVMAYPVKGECYDIGTKEALDYVDNMLKN